MSEARTPSDMDAQLIEDCHGQVREAQLKEERGYAEHGNPTRNLARSGDEARAASDADKPSSDRPGEGRADCHSGEIEEQCQHVLHSLRSLSDPGVPPTIRP